MNGMMRHKGYFGSVHYSDEDGVLHGKLEGIRDLVTYEDTDINGLKNSFKKAVEDYIKTCEQHGKTPERPFKGSFNVRIGRDLHARAAVHAAETNKRLNTVVTEALEKYLTAKG